MTAYYTLICSRTTPAFTNEWNSFVGVDWTTQTRGCFRTEQAACEWAREHLIHGAPFALLYIPAFDESVEAVSL